MVLILLGIALAISACSGLPARTVEVKVPVPVPCKVTMPESPALPVDVLQGTEDAFVIGKALWSTIDLQAAHIVQLEAAVKSCQ